MKSVLPATLFSEEDVYLFREGKHYRLYEKFGSHSIEYDGSDGVYFAVWAPNAQAVSVIGDFNDWKPGEHALFPRWDGSGIWEGFIPGLPWGTLYKYSIRDFHGELLEKSDPYALSWEQNLQAASLVSTNWYEWNDALWMQEREARNNLNAPISVYELHLGSWMRGTDDPNRFFSYQEIAERLIPYLKEMEFTHVEFMPVMEHPYEPSWGYQITGFYAANSRFGSPQDLMSLIDELHKNDIGVFLDWVPSHFPGDANGLHRFDGTFLYEHEDPRKGFHPQWNSYIFNYGRPEVKSFLISNALFWLDRYHADGLRVDAVTSMLYLDYARNEGEWEPNIFGGNVNLEAETFLKDFNVAVYQYYPDVMTIAEESSDFPMLTTPVYAGGIGFGMKWMMGWMHDTLDYFKVDPIARRYYHNKITFASMYMYNENYMMPLSHDEVVHGKASMIYKMTGDEWQKFANLRALYLLMYTSPGAKLLFMGNEFGQTREWNFAMSLDWHLLQYPVHKGLQKFVKDLNHLYRTQTSLYQNQFKPEGFEWVEANDNDNSIFVYLRKGKKTDDVTMTVLNLTPRVFEYKIGVNEGTNWEVILNSDENLYGGSGVDAEITDEEDDEWMFRPNNIVLRLPPLAGVVLKQIKKRKIISKLKKSARVIISASVVTELEKEAKIGAKKIQQKRTPRKTEKTSTAVSGAAKKIAKPRKSQVSEPVISASAVSKAAGEEQISSKKVKENDDSVLMNRKAAKLQNPAGTAGKKRRASGEEKSGQETDQAGEKE